MPETNRHTVIMDLYVVEGREGMGHIVQFDVISGEGASTIYLQKFEVEALRDRLDYMLRKAERLDLEKM